MTLSNEELFAKAHAALWVYESGLGYRLDDVEQKKFIAEFILHEQKNAAKFRL